MRLIDADVLSEHKFLSPQYKQIGGRRNGKTLENINLAYQKGWNDAISAVIDNAPTIEIPTWIPVETREPDAEEREEICRIYGEAAVDDMPMFCGPMPEDGQEILISTPYGVLFDICSVDCEEGLNTLALENQGDWEGVTAWMPLPKPYKRGDV